MQTRVSLALLMLSIAPLAGVHAQSYPNRVVRIVVPTSAGGGGDVIARLIAKALGERWGRQVVVDNRTGAGTMLGSELVARAAPDGYTLLMTHSGLLGLAPMMFVPQPYDSIRDFAPVSVAAAMPMLLLAHPGLAAKSVSELVALAKAQPGKLNFASEIGRAHV